MVAFVTLSLCFSSISLARETGYLTFEVDGMMFTSSQYLSQNYYCEKSYENENIIIEIFARDTDALIERFVFYPPEQNAMTRAESYIQRTFDNTVYRSVSFIPIVGVTNRILVEIKLVRLFHRREHFLQQN